MTESLGPEDPYTTAFEATVERADGTDVVLDRTYFYAEGGGQPADRGTVAGVPVTAVKKRENEVVHTLAEAPDLAPGETVAASVDESFRTYCMRAHTASHVLYGAGRRLLADLGYGGFDIDEEKVRVDFRSETAIDDGVLVELERLSNRAVWESRAVRWEEVPREEALARDDVAFNAKTEEGVMANADAIRIVEVEGWDAAACGGTHVKNTREIGPVTVLERSNPGEGLTRVEFAVGPPGIERRATEREATLEAARALGTRVRDLPEAVRRLEADRATLESTVEELTDRVVEARLDELREEAVERNGTRWLVGRVEGLDANELGERAKGMAGDEADVVALVGGDDGSAFLAVAADGEDAAEVVDDVTDAFGGGGGGSPGFAQAGGLRAAPGDVVTFVRDGGPDGD